MDKDEIKILGQRLKAERKRRRMTQAELAESLGIGFSTLQALEIGVSKAIGKRVRGIVENFLDGAENLSEKPTGVLEAIAKIVFTTGFVERVAGVAKLLAITQEEAAVVIFREELKKDKNVNFVE